MDVEELWRFVSVKKDVFDSSKLLTVVHGE
jgi:hypothetical protein